MVCYRSSPGGRRRYGRGTRPAACSSTCRSACRFSIEPADRLFHLLPCCLDQYVYCCWLGNGLLSDKVLCAHVRGVANIDVRVIGEKRDHETKAQAKLCSAHTQFTGWIKWWPT